MECHPPIRTGHKLGAAMPNFSNSTGHSLGYSTGYPHDIPLNSIKSSCLMIKPPLFHIIPQIFGHLRNWVKRAEKKQAVMFMDGGDRESLRMVLVQGRGKKTTAISTKWCRRIKTFTWIILVRFDGDIMVI